MVRQRFRVNFCTFRVIIGHFPASLKWNNFSFHHFFVSLLIISIIVALINVFKTVIASADFQLPISSAHVSRDRNHNHFRVTATSNDPRAGSPDPNDQQRPWSLYYIMGHHQRSGVVSPKSLGSRPLRHFDFQTNIQIKIHSHLFKPSCIGENLIKSI